MSDSSARRALVSVSDKAGLAPFIKQLTELGFEIISTGGTRRHLEEAGVPVIGITEYTGFPEIMEGRVKTLHPKVHGAILGRPDRPDDAEAIAEHEIVPFELVVCNLYPFEETIAREGVTVAEAIEQIDIGGPSMVRSAAKNHAYIAIVTQAEQYSSVLEALQGDGLDEHLRQELATAAFEMTATYDRAIADYMAGLADEDSQSDDSPLTITLNPAPHSATEKIPTSRAVGSSNPTPTPPPWRPRKCWEEKNSPTTISSTSTRHCRSSENFRIRRLSSSSTTTRVVAP